MIGRSQGTGRNRDPLGGRAMNEESLFAEALGKQGETRAAFLDEHCQEDVRLRKRLEALLRDLPAD